MSNEPISQIAKGLSSDEVLVLRDSNTTVPGEALYGLNSKGLINLDSELNVKLTKQGLNVRRFLLSAYDVHLYRNPYVSTVASLWPQLITEVAILDKSFVGFQSAYAGRGGFIIAPTRLSSDTTRYMLYGYNDKQDRHIPLLWVSTSLIQYIRNKCMGSYVDEIKNEVLIEKIRSRNKTIATGPMYTLTPGFNDLVGSYKNFMTTHAQWHVFGLEDN